MGILDIRDLNLSIDGTPILKDVSLSVGQGEILGLVGESGSGKSMTAMAILGLTPPRTTVTGQILLNGQPIAGASDQVLQTLRGAQVGIIFQEPMTALNPVMTIGDQVAEPLRHHRGLSRRAALDQARATLERVGLPADQFPLTRYPHELSGGQRQRVAIARALALDPDVLVCDEPTSALDVSVQAQVLELLARLQDEQGLACLFITHDLRVVWDIAHRVAVMRDGRILETAATERLFRAPEHPYTAELLAAAGVTAPLTGTQTSAGTRTPAGARTLVGRP